jgi:NADH-quinone oxidoreductase subunit F
VDLRPSEIAASAEESEAVELLLRGELGDQFRPQPEFPVGFAQARRLRHLLLPGLHALQRRVGWISPAGLGYLCKRLHVPPAEGYAVASFYALFATQPRPANALHVCGDLACKMAGSDALMAELTRRAGPEGQPTAATAAWHRSPCLGLCEQAPAALRTQAGEFPRDDAWGHATAGQLIQALQGGAVPAAEPCPMPQDRSDLKLLRRIGAVDPQSLADYRAHGGYLALAKALELGPQTIIAEISASGLMGRGGAAFPTGRKWAAVAAQTAAQKYLVCNADESEPGTFKDRALMEGDPFALVEAMTIAALAVGASRGYLYLRAEYPLAHARMHHAIAEAYRAGLLGRDILGQGLDVDLEIRRGAGAYICGEETALLASIEGYRGEPRTKPPFPVEVGLFGQPTCINNVETLASVPEIVLGGGAAYAATGTAKSAGTKLFCVSGQVERPGVYELALGTRLSTLLAMAGAREPGAVLLGGAAGTFVVGEELDVPLSFEDTRAIGATLGSGVVLVLGRETPVLPLLQTLAGFFRDESCGQCTPCRVGTVRVEELLARLAGGENRGGDPPPNLWKEQALLADLAQCMRDASICGLGQTATSAIESAMAKLPLWAGRDTPGGAA